MMNRLIELIDSLSITYGAVLVAILSMSIVRLLCFVVPMLARWICALVVPLLIAYCLYWPPVWLGADSSEYSAWAVLCMGTWFLAGAVASTDVADTSSTEIPERTAEIVYR
jgi:hypothetical protein